MNKFLISLSAGIVLGILFAPSKGSETRRKIADGLNGLADSLHNAAENIYDEAQMEKDTMETVRRTGREMYS